MNNQPTIRTQISLTPSLKKAIEDKRNITGESLSAYLRKAALLRLQLEEEEKKDLKELARIVVGSVSLKEHTEWQNKKKLKRWLTRLRKDWQ